MKNPKQINLKNIHLTGILTLVLIFLLIGVFSLTYPMVKNTQLYNNLKNTYQDNVWVTFTSERARFSFKHPLNWPVVSASDYRLKEGGNFAESGYAEVESIDFDKEWVTNAGGPRLGFITVQKIKGINNLDDYIKQIDKEMILEGTAKGRIVIPPPDISSTEVGGEKAIKVQDKSTVGRFSREINDYRLVKNGLLYRFTTVNSTRYLENKEKNYDTFQKILATVKFLN